MKLNISPAGSFMGLQLHSCGLSDLIYHEEEENISLYENPFRVCRFFLTASLLYDLALQYTPTWH
jgi:hypothetical protein